MSDDLLLATRAELNASLQPYEDQIKPLRAQAHDEGFEIHDTSLQVFGYLLTKAPFRVRLADLSLGQRGEINAAWTKSGWKTRFQLRLCQVG